MKVKCPSGLNVRFKDGEALDLQLFLTGHMAVKSYREMVASHVLSDDEISLGYSELNTLLLAADWIEIDELAKQSTVDGDTLKSMIANGLLITEKCDSEVLDRERRAVEQGWYPQALTYHLASRWRDRQPGADLKLQPGAIQDRHDVDRGFVRHAERFGEAPPAFYYRDEVETCIDLSRPGKIPVLEPLFQRRKTVRLFDDSRSLPSQVLSDLLYAVWGCRGKAELAPGVQVQRKASPSGGGLHPIECYPLVRQVEGVPPGVYHYCTATHQLACLQEKPAAELQSVIAQLLGEQRYFATAHVVFVMAARFYRTAWKYRDHAKAYRVAILDSGHVSQNLYLSATALGLGAFVTAAINEANADDLLGLDGIEQGTIAVCGSGLVDDVDNAMTLRCEDYDPVRNR